MTMNGEGKTVEVHGVRVRGVGVGAETRCAHYDGERDVIAIRFACCGTYFPCYRCHAAAADHDSKVRPRSSFDDPGVLCGVCGAELSVSEYLNAADACPRCGAAFNPGCAAHYDRYFEME